MIAKRADVLPFWEISRAKLNQYGPNSVVYYQNSPDSAGYAYRAKTPYTETNQPPDLNADNWSIDKTFAVPWKEDGKYETGSRVYYFNGARAYVYKPSPRYFGGTQPPNEELDQDGIRTWEIEMSYDYDEPSYASKSEFLIPVKKFVGFTGSKVGSFSPTDPEERPVAYSINIGGGGIADGKDEIVNYLIEKGIISSDYVEFNSIYQSNPYDSGVYVFERLNTQNNTYTHLKKGIHRAVYLKQLSVDYPSNYNPKYYAHAKSQYVHTYNSGFNNFYYKSSGFAVEMWPNVSDSDYELVPTSGIQYYGYLYSQSVPSHNVAIIPEYNYGEPFDAISFVGEIPDDPNGVGGTDGTPPESLKYDAVFSRSSPAFNYRISKLAILREDYIFNGYEAIAYQVNEGGVWITKYNYNQRPNSGPFYSMSYETIDSMEESYKEEDGSFKELLSVTRSKNKGNPIDFGPYISSGTYTTLIWAGYEID